MKEISLKFDGFYPNSPSQPDSDVPGIFVVYAGKVTPDNRCVLNRVLYIGETNSTITQAAQSKKLKEKLNQNIDSDEVLYYAITEVRGEAKKQATAALIFANKPICNEQQYEEYPYDSITLSHKSGSIKTSPLISTFKISN